MNYPSTSSGVSKGTTMSKVKVKLLFKDFLIRTLVCDVLLDSFRFCVFAHRVRVEAACPKVPAPKEPLYFFMPSKDFTGGDALDYGHDLAYRHCWHTLYEKMHMILIHPNLHKADFVPHGYACIPPSASKTRFRWTPLVCTSQEIRGDTEATFCYDVCRHVRSCL